MKDILNIKLLSASITIFLVDTLQWFAVLSVLGRIHHYWISSCRFYHNAGRLLAKYVLGIIPYERTDSTHTYQLNLLHKGKLPVRTHEALPSFRYPTEKRECSLSNNSGAKLGANFPIKN